MSYAQPSPPKIQFDFLTRYCLRLIISFASSDLSFSHAAITLSEAILEGSALSLLLNHSSKAVFISPETLLAEMASFILRAMRSLNLFAPNESPRPYSALSSNSELAHAGP